jgi:flagellar biosynthesis GTPase FlhF
VNDLNKDNQTDKTRKYNPSGRRWWLKLEYAFFFDKRVCALRRKLGDRALIFYEKIMLRSLENSCTMRFEGLEETFEDEIAVDIMEDNGDSVQLIREIMDFLIQHRLMIEQEDKSFLFTQAAEMSGDECSSAERMRRMRERNREASECYAEPSQSDNQPSQGNETSQCDKETSQRYQIQNNKQNNRTDRATDIAKAKAISVAEQESETEEANADFVSAERDASAAADAAAPPAVGLFSLSELLDIRRKHEIDINGEGISVFLAEMRASGWMLYKSWLRKTGL